MKSTSHEPMPPASGSQAERTALFSHLTRQFAANALAEGIPVRAFRETAPRHFPQLSKEEQERVLATFGAYVDVAQETLAHNESLTKQHQFLWRMIRKLGLHPLEDFFSTLKEDDVVEIYDMPSNIQVFRSLNLFSLTSYTLDELLCRPWFDLFQRDDDISEKIMRTVQKVLTQENPETVSYDLPLHLLKETDSERRFLCECDNLFVSPLLNQDKEPKAVINIGRGRILSEERGAQ